MTTPQGAGWRRIEGNLKYVSCGLYGCWGVSKQGKIYFRLGVSRDLPQGNRWIIIPGNMHMVESGPLGVTVGLSDNANHIKNVFYRTGVTANKPEGTDWVQLDLRFAHVTVGRRGIWGILPDGTVAAHKSKNLTATRYYSIHCTRRKCAGHAPLEHE